MIHLYVDADACPVKAEVYRVATRYGLEVSVVSNTWIRVPAHDGVQLVVVDRQFDAADDWIAERITDRDILVSDDILLAARCLQKGARALSPRGRVFDDNTIGDAIATRELLSNLRDMGEVTGGPAPFEKPDRSQFLQRLDATIQSLRRRR